jgi:N utilization substance protein B
MSSSEKKYISMSSARLFAVQAVYQMVENEDNAANVVHDFLNSRIEQALHQEKDMAAPDKEYFSKIVTGAESRQDDLVSILDGALKAVEEGSAIAKTKKREPLLYAIFVCGAYELLAHHEIEAPIIINDYLNVGHAFFDGGEVKLINGTLDKVSKSVRD